MLRVNNDILVMDRGVNEVINSRYVVVVALDGTVDVNGLLTTLGKQFSHSAMTEEAIRHGAEVISADGCVVGGDDLYKDDVVKAYNKDDLIFENESIAYWLLMQGYATKV